jgi:hypothetical protein
LGAAAGLGARFLVAVFPAKRLRVRIVVGAAFGEWDPVVPNGRAGMAPELEAGHTPRARGKQGGAGLL